MRPERPPIFPIVGVEPVDAEGFYRLQLDLEKLARERAERKEFPEVYPEEPQAVRGFLTEVKSLWEKGRETKEYAGLLLRVANAWKENRGEGVMHLIYENLNELISGITSGKIKDFDAYRDCKYGDHALALLGQYFSTLERNEQALPKLERRVFYPGEEKNEQASDRGAVLFICGYGATLEPYKGIFRHMNVPVVAYQLPHGVISEDPNAVKEVFGSVYDAMREDPLIGNVTHVIGNSIGTMFASRLAVDLCREDPERNVELALVQVGMGWQGALEKTNAKFGRQLRDRVARRGLTLADFSEATEPYNPGALVDDTAEFVANSRLNLSLFAGLDDQMISPVAQEFEPLLKKLDSSKASGKYNAYTSDVACHNSAVLFFLW
ncbi:hypothetical protein HYW68_02045, partial [Candidatus Parcubacteria bacterium]|nr:hypothetical protein [Candidatus Parcubacteria bacterium]